MIDRTVRTLWLRLARDGLEFSKQVPLRASPAISQVAKRGSANLALHNLLSIPHRKHQVGIIPNGLSSPQWHEPGPFAQAALSEHQGGSHIPRSCGGWTLLRSSY